MKIPDEFRVLLLLDFDTRESYREFPMRARFLARWLDAPLSIFRLRRRRTARGWHVIIYARGGAFDNPLFIVAVQALLGSDWKREGFNLVRAMHLHEAPLSWQKTGRWNTLYERKMGVFNEGIRESAPPVVHTSPVLPMTDEGLTDGD